MMHGGRKPPDPRDSGHTLAGMQPAGNGGPHGDTPPSGTDLRGMGDEERAVYTLEALRQVTEDVATTRGLVDRAVIHARHSDETSGATREDMRAMRAAVTGLSQQVHEMRKITNERIDVIGLAVERIEGALLVELSRLGAAFVGLDRRVAKAEADATAARESATEAEGWAAKSGQREMNELQLRASKGEALIEDIARKALADNDERRKQDRDLVAEGRRAGIKAGWKMASAALAAVLGIASVVIAAKCGG